MGGDHPHRLRSLGLKRGLRIDVGAWKAALMVAAAAAGPCLGGTPRIRSGDLQLAVEGHDAAPMPCREEAKPVSIAATPVCRRGTVAIFSVI